MMWYSKDQIMASRMTVNTNPRTYFFMLQTFKILYTCSSEIVYQLVPSCAGHQRSSFLSHSSPNRATTFFDTYKNTANKNAMLA